ncbi:MAG TPA: PAS domain S-box protein [Gemmatimonadales bacterium]|jgi:PAS domain S-box-containing protein
MPDTIDVQRLHSAALDAAANAIVITDREGIMVWVNPAFTRLTGFSAEEALGKNPRDLIKSGAHEPAFYRDLWQTVLAGNVWHGEMTNRRKDGTVYPEEQTITPVKDAQGKITHFIAIKQDLTEAKRLEAQIQQAQKMESVGHLAGGIAHDFNNLLGVITVFGELAGDGLPADDPRRADLQNIQDAVQRAATLTRQLLAFSRQQVLHPRVLDPNAVITDLMKMLGRLIGEDIEMITELDKNAGRVRIDTGQLEQVLVNLAVNARDAMPRGGKLRIATSPVQLDNNAAHQQGLERAGGYAVLTVSDTGSGMSAETQARAFEPFFTTKGTKGTGLGLATVHGIIRQSHGNIVISSTIGTGTTLTVFLPQVASHEEERRAMAREPETQGGSETVLLVEDDAAIRLAASTVLMRLGYMVIVALTGEEALAQADRHQGAIHLVISDVVLPGLDGLGLVGRLREQRPKIKALLMSGYPSDSMTRRGVEQSGLPFLEKPFSTSSLSRGVRDALDSVTPN